MKHFTFILFAILCHINIFSQKDTITFESYQIPTDSFINNSMGEHFVQDGVTFNNTFSVSNGFESWGGFSVSNQTDSITAGFGNQYSSRTAKGYESENYLVSFSSAYILLPADSKLVEAKITNNTYAYQSMANGDAFAKKFGGATGDDPDFLSVTAKGYLSGVIQDSVTVYLADFRFEDNAEDFILKDWATVGFSEWGVVDSIHFSYESSDVGAFGINTPTYFCMDNVVVEKDNSTPTVQVVSESSDFKVFPNPVQDFLYIESSLNKSFSAAVFTMQGQMVWQNNSLMGVANIEVNRFEEGIYVLVLESESSRWVEKVLVK